MNPNGNSSSAPPPPTTPTPAPITPAPASQLNEGLRDMANEPTQPEKAFSSGMPDPFAKIDADPNQSDQPQQPSINAQSNLSGHSTQYAPVNIPTSTQTLEQLNTLAAQQQTSESQPTQDQLSQQQLSNPDPSTMNPSQYLDQIAPPPSPGNPLLKFLTKKNLFLAGGVMAFFVVILIIGAAFSGRQPASLTYGIALGNNLANLQALLDYRDVASLNSDTRKIVAEARLITISQQNDLGEVITLSSSESSTATDTTGISEELDAARARGRLNDVYIENLHTRISAIKTQLNNLSRYVNTDAARTRIQQAITDFEELAYRIPAN